MGASAFSLAVWALRGRGGLLECQSTTSGTAIHWVSSQYEAGRFIQLRSLSWLVDQSCWPQLLPWKSQQALGRSCHCTAQAGQIHCVARRSQHPCHPTGFVFFVTGA